MSNGIKNIQITEEALGDLVLLINSAKQDGVSDVAACISAEKDELRVSISYNINEGPSDVRTITVKLHD